MQLKSEKKMNENLKISSSQRVSRDYFLNYRYNNNLVNLLLKFEIILMKSKNVLESMKLIGFFVES